MSILYVAVLSDSAVSDLSLAFCSISDSSLSLASIWPSFASSRPDSELVCVLFSVD
jgi:hypothetical protein